MELLLLREAIVILATGLGAYADHRTGLIYDWITLPLIAIGILLNAFESERIAFYAVGIVVFLAGYALYYAGKLGGGDVKLFTGIALALPFLGGYPFIITALFVAAFASIICLSVWFVSKYVKAGIDWKKNRNGIRNALILGIGLAVYLGIVWFYDAASIALITFLAIIFAFGLPFMAFEAGIKEKFFLKRVSIGKLEEDEIIATEYLPEKAREKLGLKWKGVLGEKEKEELKKMKLRAVEVYRELPRFGPFAFIGVIVAIAFPELLKILFFIG
ncbi:MAG: A24 family peptidase [archaeon]